MKNFLLPALAAVWLSLGTSASYAASLEVGSEAFQQQDYSKALQHLQPLAEQGNADALYLLAQMYEKGTGVPLDKEKAKVYYQGAASQGNMDALNALRSLKNEDYRKELDALLPRAKAGDAEAQNRLGKMYEFGQGTERSPEQAFHWYSMAATQNLPEGILNRGRCYNLAIGINQNFHQAENDYRAAAQLGLDEAMFWLGAMYFNNHGEDKSDDADVIGYAWLKNAADKGHAIALKMISRLELKLTSEQLQRARNLAESIKAELNSKAS
ncbi:tetratricopeptide repeat protein [Pokkaliibacter sp. MBI-7]|uniref:tetratricopeptide repeat protein n=1 Tax=Pokkaliibacter sp. MBI-7 TaxID=3040600 RepID=UPI00244A113A|nr:tetratricopeptide repeat protein [Pokkaliibacter sp. MBI-7]MDH2431976.1 tetratricopeptide repeat protein [Pokkaliibacter sp. MBI-7]